MTPPIQELTAYDKHVLESQKRYNDFILKAHQLANEGRWDEINSLQTV